MNALHLTVLQLDLVWHDPFANRARIDQKLHSLTEPTDLVLLPEMFTTGFTMDVEKHHEEAEGTTTEWMQAWAKKLDCLLGGSIIVKEDGSYYNRFFLVAPEGIMAEYDKRHLFRMAAEDDYFMEGNEFVRIKYKGWKIAPLVCYDLRFPVWSRNRANEEGELDVDLLLYVANWPASRVSHWDILLKARAVENQCFVAGVNRVGRDGNEVDYNGSSAIIDPKGQVLTHEMDRESVLTASLDSEMMVKYRNKFPAWKDADTFELFL